MRGLPFDSAFARSNGAPLNPTLALVEVFAGVLGGKASTTTGQPATAAAPTASIDQLVAMAQDAKGGDG
ncbi:MAG: hypothetical protein AAGA99_21075 [Actinomycetota bacterium]